MSKTQQRLKLFEKLHRGGTPLDQKVLEEARAACRGLRITQTGNCIDSALYSQASGGVGIMLSVAIENISDRPIAVKSIHLKMPWPHADFHWLEKLSSRELRERGYVLPACGACGFDPDVIVNHRFGRDFKLDPGEEIEGLLLGEGTTAVPEHYPDGKLVPVELTVFAARREAYGAWIDLLLCREKQRSSRQSGQPAIAAPNYAD